MYNEFFGFRESPFNITPDPRFLYLNDCYQEAAAALGYGIEARKGFLSLIGEAGTGKTTLLRHLVDTLPSTTRTVVLLTPRVAFDELLENILLELGIPTDGGRKLVYLQRLREFLVRHTADGGNVAFLIDEAQDLDDGVLEELRLLSNLESGNEKVLQIVLAGQPELETKLASASLRQLWQRITLHIRLRSLSPEEVAAYVRTRLGYAGARDINIFEPEALVEIGRVTSGIPRVVNVLCDACLKTACEAGTRRVTQEMVSEGWRQFERKAAPPSARPAAATVPPPMLPPRPANPAPPQIVITHNPTVAPEPSAKTSRIREIAVTGAAIVALVASAYQLRHPEIITPVQIAAPSAAEPVPVAAVPETQPAEPVAAAQPPATPDPVPTIITTAEATSLVEEFRRAHESRDVERLRALFADDARASADDGIEQIAAFFRARHGSLDELRYSITGMQVIPRSESVVVRAPVTVRYREVNGLPGRLDLQAEWRLEKRDGRARIVGVSYRPLGGVPARTEPPPQLRIPREEPASRPNGVADPPPAPPVAAATIDR